MRNWFSRDKLSKFERDIIANVDRHGCHLTSVFDPDGEHPSFTYSVGFTQTMAKVGKPDFPEVIIFGLSGDVSAQAINELLAMCAAGQRLEDQTRIEGFFGDFDCIVRIVHPSRIDAEYFNSAMWYHSTQMGSEFAHAAMLVWPDENGRFPWEAGCDAWVIADQPPLYEAELSS